MKGANTIEKDSGSCDMELKIHNANTHIRTYTHTVTRGRTLSCSHTPPFIVFVCCFHGNVPPYSTAYQWNGLKSIGNSRESYFCSLGAQCGSNRRKLFRALISFHTWIVLRTKLELGPVFDSILTAGSTITVKTLKHAVIKRAITS